MKKLIFLIIGFLVMTPISQADLYDRLTATGEDNINKIEVHAFAASLREMARGAVTNSSIDTAFSLDVTEQAQLDAIASEYASKPNNQQKAEYLVKIHDVFVLSEAGLYTEAKAKSELGF